MRLVIMFQVMQLLLQLSSLTPVSSARSLVFNLSTLEQLSSLTPVASARSLVFNLSPQRVAEVNHAVSNNVSSYATAPAATSGAVNTSSGATVAATTITKTSTSATAISSASLLPPAPNSTVLPQQWILPFYQHYLMITTLQLFLHLFGSADRVWVNSLPKIPGHDRIILFFIARRRNWSDWANPPPTTTTVNAHPL